MNKIIKLKNFPEVESFLKKNDVTFIQMLENKTWGFIIIYKEKDYELKCGKKEIEDTSVWHGNNWSFFKKRKELK